MAKAVWTTDSINCGKALFGGWGDGRATVKQAVHDGDTVLAEADGNISVRFLGIDTPEKSFIHPDKNGFPKVDPNFIDYLSNPFSDSRGDSEAYKKELSRELVSYLEEKLGPDCAVNHASHAEKAHRKLEEFIQRDVDAIEVVGGEDPLDIFRFFMAFAYEMMDCYGRFLCYLHQHLPKDKREGRISYNEEMLKHGMAEPYFIFPNINPFRKAGGIVDAVPERKNFSKYVQDWKLEQAREYVSKARKDGNGIFDENTPLTLEPFELRFLARRKPPSRWVIDLTVDKPDLLKPTNYYKIPNAEDRLFINREHVPLFKEKGYKVE